LYCGLSLIQSGKITNVYRHSVSIGICVDANIHFPYAKKEETLQFP
jgi:hypothetical protein